MLIERMLLWAPRFRDRPFEQRQALGDSGGTIRDVSARHIAKLADDDIHRGQQIDIVNIVVCRRHCRPEMKNV